VTGGEVEPHKGIAPLTLAVYQRDVYLLFERRGRFHAFAVKSLANVEGHADLLFDYPLPSEYDPTRELAASFGVTDEVGQPK